MHFYSLAHSAYTIARKIATAAGLAKPLRKLIGPQAGRFVSNLTVDANRLSEVRGHRMFLASGGTYPPIAMATDKYEEETTRLFERLVKPGMVVVDVGSHVGYYALMAARQVGPAGRVYAFEPEPSNHELLLKNIELNGYTNVAATRKAVSSKVGEATLFLTALDNGRNSTYHHGLPEKGSVAVETTTVDAFLAAEGWPTVDLVKVDVEGAEMDVLAGMCQLLDKSRDLKLIIEFSPSLLRGAGASPLLFLGHLDVLDFEVNCISARDGLSSLREADRPPLIDKLLKSEGSLNLFCSKR